MKAAYTRHTAVLLHRMTHNYSPEVCEVATVHLQAAQRARNTCPRWVLRQTGMPTDMNTRLWNHLQLLLPSPHHAILTNHTCPEQGPLAVLCRDRHHHPKGTIHTIDHVGASITVVYVTLPQMRVLHHSGAHQTPFLQLSEWPQYRLFHQYLTQTARAAGHTLPGSKDMRAAYRDFKKQHPRPIPATPPYAPTGWKHDPVPPVTGPVLPLTLLLALNEAKPTQTTVIHHGAQWRIPKHHMTAPDLPRVPHDSQSMPCTCWTCDPEAPTTPWPVLHLIARDHTHPTTHLPPQAYTWVAPWFHRTDTNPTVAWNPDHAPKWLFTITPTWRRPDPAGVAIRYSMYEPGRTGKHEHPYYPLHYSCHTLEHRTLTLTCHDLNPDTAYILHYIYSHLTQGQPEQGLIAMSPQAKHIISKGIGVYATPILQPTTPIAHLATGLAIYAYLPMNQCRLPKPSPADRLFFTDASGESALTPITGGATLQLIHTGGHYHMDHHTGHTTYGASSHGELGAMADAIAKIAVHLPAHLLHIVRVWFFVDATVDTHLLLRIARKPLHKATATSLGTQVLLLWKALRSLPPYVQLHIVKQESHRHQYGNGKVDNQAVHQRTTHLPTLQSPDLGQNHTHLQHIPPVPELHQTPDWVPEDASYSSHDRAYHYPNPIQHLARVLGDADSRAHIQELQDRLQIPLYQSALRPAKVPAHLQERRIQLLREQLPFFTRVARWLARKHIHVPEEHTCCPCDHTTPEDWEHFKKCPLHTGRDTLVGWSPAETLHTTRRMANPQARTPGHRTPLRGSPGQRSHHERGGDTGPAPTPQQTHGKPHGGSSAPPARSSPQSSGRNGTSQTPPVNTRGATHRPQRQSGVGERPTPDAPHRPRQPAQRASSRGWESARPRTPHNGPGSPPRGRAVGGGRASDPGRPTPAPAARPEGEQSGVGERPTPDAPHRPRQPAERAGSRGRESARPRTPQGTPPGDARPPPPQPQAK